MRKIKSKNLMKNPIKWRQQKRSKDAPNHTKRLRNSRSSSVVENDEFDVTEKSEVKEAVRKTE